MQRPLHNQTHLNDGPSRVKPNQQFEGTVASTLRSLAISSSRCSLARPSTAALALTQHMRLHLPNSSHLQNIEGFIRSYSPDKSSGLRVSGHKNLVMAYPFALAVAACAGAAARNSGFKTTGSIPNVSSAPYLVRMKLFEYLGVAPPRHIDEHEESGAPSPL